tara:strand:+ start:470 stop:580 length:111 start_codon:yes stop_codon:yes gene_type:complete
MGIVGKISEGKALPREMIMIPYYNNGVLKTLCEFSG